MVSAIRLLIIVTQQSKKRGLSLDEKREKMLQIFYDSQDFYLVSILSLYSTSLKGVSYIFLRLVKIRGFPLTNCVATQTCSLASLHEVCCCVSLDI